MHHAVVSKHFHDPVKLHPMCVDVRSDSIATDTQKVPTDFQRRSWIRTTITDSVRTVSTPSSNPDSKQCSETGQAITGALAESLCKWALSCEPGCSLSTNPCSRKCLSSEGQLWHFSALMALSRNHSLCSSTQECRWVLKPSNGNISSFSVHSVWFRYCVISDQLMT